MAVISNRLGMSREAMVQQRRVGQIYAEEIGDANERTKGAARWLAFFTKDAVSTAVEKKVCFCLLAFLFILFYFVLFPTHHSLIIILILILIKIKKNKKIKKMQKSAEEIETQKKEAAEQKLARKQRRKRH
jgi:hypothetical protein